MTPRSALAAPAAISDSDGYLDSHGKCDRAAPRPQLRAWKALHACNAYEPISSVVEAQSSSGMLPDVVTPYGPPVPGVGSLLQVWKSGQELAAHAAGKPRRRKLRDRARTLLSRGDGSGPEIPCGRLRTGTVH